MDFVLLCALVSLRDRVFAATSAEAYPFFKPHRNKSRDALKRDQPAAIHSPMRHALQAGPGAAAVLVSLSFEQGLGSGELLGIAQQEKLVARRH
jgi:hypothetical protein